MFFIDPLDIFLFSQAAQATSRDVLHRPPRHAEAADAAVQETARVSEGPPNAPGHFSSQGGECNFKCYSRTHTKSQLDNHLILI